MTDKQREALQALCLRYNVEFDEKNFHGGQFDLPSGYYAGWIGTAIYVGVDPEGRTSS